VKTFRELLEYVLHVTGRRRALVPLPFGVARLQAAAMEGLKFATFGLLPEEFLLTRDQVRLLEHDNVVSEEAVREGRTLPGMGITPELISSIVPTYLYRYRRSGQFDKGRAA
jgi:NADH dehydrogenase